VSLRCERESFSSKILSTCNQGRYARIQPVAVCSSRYGLKQKYRYDSSSFEPGLQDSQTMELGSIRTMCSGGWAGTRLESCIVAGVTHPTQHATQLPNRLEIDMISLDAYCVGSRKIHFNQWPRAHRLRHQIALNFDLRDEFCAILMYILYICSIGQQNLLGEGGNSIHLGPNEIAHHACNRKTWVSGLNLSCCRCLFGADLLWEAAR